MNEKSTKYLILKLAEESEKFYYEKNREVLTSCQVLADIAGWDPGSNFGNIGDTRITGKARIAAGIRKRSLGDQRQDREFKVRTAVSGCRGVQTVSPKVKKDLNGYCRFIKEIRVSDRGNINKVSDKRNNNFSKIILPDDLLKISAFGNDYMELKVVNKTLDIEFESIRKVRPRFLTSMGNWRG